MRSGIVTGRRKGQAGKLFSSKHLPMSIGRDACWIVLLSVTDKQRRL
jgi:hypothetical protein